jgi:hypothetical protein
MMRRFLPVVLVVVVALPLAAATAQAAVEPVVLGVDVSSCQTGASATQRNAVFTGSMPADSDAMRLGMRFDLQERRAGADDYKSPKLPNFGVWQKSDSGATGYVIDKRVEQLAAGSSYRVVVHYRWYAKSGKLVRKAVRTSAVCKQPDLRPDLRLLSVGVEPGSDPTTSIYRVTVRNEGVGAVVDPFRVTLALDGRALPVGEPVPSLAPGASSVASFTGPRCGAGSLLRAVVDPAGAVDESDETDNVLQRACTGR